jgi:hypothetical protein
MVKAKHRQPAKLDLPKKQSLCWLSKMYLKAVAWFATEEASNCLATWPPVSQLPDLLLFASLFDRGSCKVSRSAVVTLPVKLCGRFLVE